jgi:hypothetical protein
MEGTRHGEEAVHPRGRHLTASTGVVGAESSAQ